RRSDRRRQENKVGLRGGLFQGDDIIDQPELASLGHRARLAPYSQHPAHSAALTQGRGEGAAYQADPHDGKNRYQGRTGLRWIYRGSGSINVVRLRHDDPRTSAKASMKRAFSAGKPMETRYHSGRPTPATGRT